jgi:hypothetical protein
VKRPKTIEQLEAECRPGKKIKKRKTKTKKKSKPSRKKSKKSTTKK